MSLIETFLQNNVKYSEVFSKGDLPVAPTSRVAIVTCMDARLNIGALLGLEEGDSHVLRNAGGVITEDVIRSLTLSQRLLGTREIMLIHHTDCGMTTFKDTEMKDAIQEEIGIRPPFAMEAFADPESDIRHSIARIQASPFVTHKDAIRGFVYDVKDGKLYEVD